MKEKRVLMAILATTLLSSCSEPRCVGIEADGDKYQCRVALSLLSRDRELYDGMEILTSGFPGEIPSYPQRFMLYPTRDARAMGEPGVAVLVEVPEPAAERVRKNSVLAVEGFDPVWVAGKFRAAEATSNAAGEILDPELVR
jgi:hypothetical protein